MGCLVGWAEYWKRIGKLFFEFLVAGLNGFEGYLNLHESF
jgi:hypothetical protein